jgi:hypothetical protein
MFSKRDQSRFWLTTWRVGGLAVAVTAVGLFAHHSVAASPASEDPKIELQCDGKFISMAEPVYLPDLPRDPSTVFDSSQALAEHWLSEWNKRAPQTLHIESASAKSEGGTDFAIEDSRGRVQAVLSVINHPQLGWVVESHRECA